MQKALKYLKDKQSSSFSKSFSFHQKKSSIAQDHSSILNLKKRVLLDNFAENLLNLELDIEQPIVSISSIYKLLQLYANGVEYYESIKSNRYLIFQDKIKNLLLKPNVIEALTEYNEKKNEDINSPSQKPMPDLKLQNVKEKKTLELNVYLVKQKSNDQDIKYIMEAKKNYVEKINNIIENDISNQKNSILDKIEYRKQKTLSKVSSQPLFSSPQLPKKNRNYGRNSNEIKEIDEENKESMEFESKKRKGKSILMLRRVSTELNSMMESLNFNKENRKMSNKKEVLDFDSNSSEKKSSSVSESHTIKLIKEVKGNNDNKKKKSFDTESVEEESENEKKELNLKKIALENKFEDEIKKLEKKMGQNKNSILISKMIEKTKKDKEKAINDLIEEFN